MKKTVITKNPNQTKKLGEMMARKIFVFLILVPILAAAKAEQKKDVWAPLRILEGTWIGETAAMICAWSKSVTSATAPPACAQGPHAATTKERAQRAATMATPCRLTAATQGVRWSPTVKVRGAAPLLAAMDW